MQGESANGQHRMAVDFDYAHTIPELFRLRADSAVRGQDRNLRVAGQARNAADMILMLVRHKDGIQIRGCKAPIFEPTADLFQTKAAIDQDPRGRRSGGR